MKSTVCKTGVLFLLLTGWVTAPAFSQLPETITTTTTAGQLNLESEIDRLIQENGQSIMNGIQGYGINIGKALEEKVLDELMKGLADDAVLAPIAEKILTIYNDKKSKSLAQELVRLRTVIKDAESRKLKNIYQDYKVDYERWTSGSTLATQLTNSVTEQNATAVAKTLFGRYASVLDEFYTDQAKHDLIRSTDSGMGFFVIGTSATVAGTEDLEKKLALSNRQYREGSSDEIANLSTYDRLMMKQQVGAEALKRQAALTWGKTATRSYVLHKKRPIHRAGYVQPYKLQTTY